MMGQNCDSYLGAELPENREIAFVGVQPTVERRHGTWSDPLTRLRAVEPQFATEGLIC